MKRAGLIAAGMMLAMVCAAQMPPGHGGMGGGNAHGGMQGAQGVVPSNRMEFGTACGIQDSSPQSAIRLTRSAEGMWSTISTEKRPEPTDSGVARVWREHNWMVDIHEAPGRGMNVTKMHTGQMCFNGQGRILHMMDRYMDMPNCNCMRFTDLSFDEATGRVTRREQHFLNASTGEPIAVPESAKDFPEIWGFRRLEQLPFYSLVKK